MLGEFYRRQTLPVRLTLAISAVILVVLATNFIAVTKIMEQRLMQVLNAEMNIHALELKEITRIDAAGQPRFSGTFSDQRYADPRSGFYWQVRREGFAPLRSRSLGDANLPVIKPAVSEGTHNAVAHGWRGELALVETIVPQRSGPPLRISVATEQRVIRNQVWGMHALRAEINLIAGLVLLPLIMLAIARVQLPLVRLRHEIAKLEEGTVSHIPGRYPPDVTPLVDKLNHVISAYRKTAQENRVQTEMLAHNVRGTLAIMEDELRRLRQGTAGQEAVTEIENQCRSIQRYVESYVVKSERVNDALLSPGIGADVELVLERMVEVAQRLHATRRLDWELGVGPECRLACSERVLGEILFNLLDNAGKWANSRVQCDWRVIDWPQGSGDDPVPMVEIAIRDDGPGLPEGPQAATASPAQRRAANPHIAPHGGNGLGVGLALSRELAQMHGGGISLGKNSPPGLSGHTGTCLLLHLPLASA